MKTVGMHLHSSYSDGKDRPAELVQKAVTDGLKAACLTDHDLYQGLDEFQQEAWATGLEVIPAMEVSANWNNRSFVHLLAYGIDYRSKEHVLRNGLRKNWEAHQAFSEEIIRRLVWHYSINFSSAWIRKRSGQLGPISFTMPTVKFLENYLGLKPGEFRQVAFNGRYVFEDAITQGFYLTVEEAMQLIHSVGGKAVLAHPGLYPIYTVGKSSEQDFLQLLTLLVDLGLSGIETFYPSHTAWQTWQFQNLAKRFGLWQTAGSDYHGAYKPNCGLAMPGMDLKEFRKFKSFCEHYVI